MCLWCHYHECRRSCPQVGTEASVSAESLRRFLDTRPKKCHCAVVMKFVATASNLLQRGAAEAKEKDLDRPTVSNCEGWWGWKRCGSGAIFLFLSFPNKSNTAWKVESVPNLVNEPLSIPLERGQADFKFTLPPYSILNLHFLFWKLPRWKSRKTEIPGSTDDRDAKLKAPSSKLGDVFLQTHN